MIADGVMKAGNTSLSFDAAGKPVLTFPIPGVAGATGTATLDAKYMVEKVVVTQGATTTEFTYSNYPDWNNPLNKIEVFYAGRLIEKKNGAVVRDLTTSETETGNVYVVAPVPPSVQKAMNVTTKAPTIVFARQEPPTNTTAPTPRIGGHPDLTGNWAEFNIGWIGNYGSRRCGPTQEKPCTRATNQTEDFELYSPSRFGMLGRPLYKPEYWDKVQQLDMWTNKEDPVMTCQPLGLPRQGPPRRIFQTENDIIFLYGQFPMRVGDTRNSVWSRLMPVSTDRTRSMRPRTSATRWDAGRAIRSCWTPSASSTRHGSDAAATSIPMRCTSSRSSGVKAMPFSTT